MGERISLGDDLMREHGLMNRLILLYKESANSVRQNDDARDVLKSTAKIMLEFIHEFHEENEENAVYPLFNDDKKLHRITRIMEEQHDVGKLITQQILDTVEVGSAPDSATASRLTEMISQFQQMYIPHAAQEDTLLWPAVQEMKGDAAYMKMGTELEEKENERFGEEYFDKLVSRVERMENKLGIDNLAKFTAQVEGTSEQKMAA